MPTVYTEVEVDVDLNEFDTDDLIEELPAESEKPATIYYRIGVTDNNRIAFQIGYSEITMNRKGVDNLIEQLEMFRNQLHEEETE